MNHDRMAGILTQCVGMVKQQWGAVTGDKAIERSGILDQIAGKAREDYGVSREASANQLRDFVDRNRNWRMPDR